MNILRNAYNGAASDLNNFITSKINKSSIITENQKSTMNTFNNKVQDISDKLNTLLSTIYNLNKYQQKSYLTNMETAYTNYNSAIDSLNNNIYTSYKI